MSFDLYSGGATILRRQLFTTVGTTNWNRPAKMLGDTVWVTAIGGGGSGGAVEGYGGSGGQYIIRFPITVTTTSVPVVVGSGGSPVTTTYRQIGESGSPTSFGALLSVVGGIGGGYGTSTVHVRTSGVSGGGASSAAHSVPGMFGGLGGSPRPAKIGVGTGGGGLVLDASGTGGEHGSNLYTGGAGGEGYGAGGGYTPNEKNFSGAGASGACLVEWLEAI